MAGSVQPFTPSGNVTINSGTTVTIGTLLGMGDAVLVTNQGTQSAYVALGGDNTVTVTVANGFPVPAGLSRLLGAPSLVSTAAVITAAGSGSVVFSRGNGTGY